MRRNILIPATAIVATALYFWYEERKKRRNQIDSDMASLVMHTRAMVQTPRPQFMEMPPSPLPRRSVTDVIDTRDSPPSTSASDSASTEAPLLVSQPLICDGRQMAVAVLLIGYLVLISIASSVITLYRLC